MIIKGTIEYELLINEPDGHGVKFSSGIEDNIACMLIAAQMLEDKIASAQKVKDTSAKQQTKLDMSREIADMKKVLKYVNGLAYTLCNHYEEFQLQSAKWDEAARIKQELQDKGIIPNNDQIKEI